MRFEKYLIESDEITQQDLNNLEKWAEQPFPRHS